MKIRPIARGDLDAVDALEASCFRDDAMPRLVLRQYFDLFRATFLVCEVDSHVVGFVIGGICGDRRDDGWILSIAVSPRHRSVGIAGALVGGVLRLLDDSGVNKVWATTEPNNTSAQHLLRSAGFRDVRTESDYFGVDTPRVLMCRTATRI